MRRQLQSIKANICKRCKKNFELEKEVRFFDQKIALLINHRISLQVINCIDDVNDNGSF